jgi:hypothetical protein
MGGGKGCQFLYKFCQVLYLSFLAYTYTVLIQVKKYKIKINCLPFSTYFYINFQNDERGDYELDGDCQQERGRVGG